MPRSADTKSQLEKISRINLLKKLNSLNSITYTLLNKSKVLLLTNTTAGEGRSVIPYD